MGLFYQNCPVQTRLNDINTVFGWVDFREDGNHREEKWVENSVFHCLAKGEKYRGWKTREKIFSPGPQISSSQIGRKTMERKSALTAKLQKCPLFPNGHNNSTKKKKTIFQPPTQHNSSSPPQPKNNSKSTQKTT